MKILVTGANGKLGKTLVHLLSHTHDVVGLGGTSHTPPFDMTQFSSVKEHIENQQPDLVVHTAGWTDVDGCALDPQRANSINGLGTQNLAVVTATWGVPLAYVSTNEVFDGTSTRPYLEYDRTQPANPYGYSKWMGEQALLSLNPRHYIIRTSWLFAHGGRNFIHAILNTVQQNKPLRVVTDEIANPTASDDLAQAIVQLVLTGRFGCYHMVNEGIASRYEFARFILDASGHHEVPITPVTRQDWQRPSQPPPFAPLDNLAGASVGVRLRSWQDAVLSFLQDTRTNTRQNQS